MKLVFIYENGKTFTKTVKRCSLQTLINHQRVIKDIFGIAIGREYYKEVLFKRNGQIIHRETEIRSIDDFSEKGGRAIKQADEVVLFVGYTDY